jgi:hypothetical protein
MATDVFRKKKKKRKKKMATDAKNIHRQHKRLKINLFKQQK